MLCVNYREEKQSVKTCSLSLGKNMHEINKNCGNALEDTENPGSLGSLLLFLARTINSIL